IDYSAGKPVLADGFSLHCSQLRQESRGSLKLASAAPADPIRIHFNFLATDRDRAEFREGIRLVREIVRQRPLPTLVEKELSPSPDHASDGDLDRYVRSAAETEFHPSCTCGMGMDAMAVVDGSLKVR